MKNLKKQNSQLREDEMRIAMVTGAALLAMLGGQKVAKAATNVAEPNPTINNNSVTTNQEPVLDSLVNEPNSADADEQFSSQSANSDSNISNIDSNAAENVSEDTPTEQAALQASVKPTHFVGQAATAPKQPIMSHADSYPILVPNTYSTNNQGYQGSLNDNYQNLSQMIIDPAGNAQAKLARPVIKKHKKITKHHHRKLALKRSKKKPVKRQKATPKKKDNPIEVAILGALVGGLIATDVIISHRRKHSAGKPTIVTDQQTEPDDSQHKVHKDIKHHEPAASNSETQDHENTRHQESDEFDSEAQVHKNVKQPKSAAFGFDDKVHENPKQPESNAFESTSKVHEDAKRPEAKAATSKPQVIHQIKKVRPHKHHSKNDFSDKFNINDHPFPFKDDQL